MHIPTGEITEINEEFLDEFRKAHNERESRLADFERQMVALTEEETGKLLPLDKQKRKGWMRNQPCVCGSGNKFKRCCWNKFE